MLNAFQLTHHSAPANRKRRLLWWTLALAVACSAACGKTHSIATVTTEADANEMIHALLNRHLAARKELIGDGKSSRAERRWQVLVDESLFEENKLAASLQVLREHGLPRPADEGFEKAYQEGGMFPSESAQKAQRLKELKTEIERQLRHLPGVVRVSANLVLPEESSININAYPATAAVLLVHKDEKPFFSRDYVKELVAKGVPKLKTDEVSVILVYEPPQHASTESPTTLTMIAGSSSSRSGAVVWAVAAGLLAVFAALCAVLLLQRKRRRAASPAPPVATSTPPTLIEKNSDDEQPAMLSEQFS